VELILKESLVLGPYLRNIKPEKIYLTPPVDGMEMYPSLEARCTWIKITEEDVSPLITISPKMFMEKELDKNIGFVGNLSLKSWFLQSELPDC